MVMLKLSLIGTILFFHILRGTKYVATLSDLPWRRHVNRGELILFCQVKIVATLNLVAVQFAVVVLESGWHQ